jgi:hypothetical protein
MLMRITLCLARDIYIVFNVIFLHVSHSCSTVESIIVEIHTEDRHIGCRELLPRDYVTGKTETTVVRHLLNNVFSVMSVIKDAPTNMHLKKEVSLWNY